METSDLNSLNHTGLVEKIIYYLDYSVYIQQDEKSLKYHTEEINKIINTKFKCVKTNVELIRDVINKYIIPLAIEQYSIFESQYINLIYTPKFKNYVIDRFFSVGNWNCITDDTKYNYVIANNDSKPALMFISICLNEYLITFKPTTC